MKFQITVTEQAQRDIEGIYEYIAFTLMEPSTASKQISRIEKAVYSLEQMPERFHQYAKEPWKSRNLRVMPVDNFLIFYLVDLANNTVTVLRAMYGRRDATRQLDTVNGDIERQNRP